MTAVRVILIKAHNTLSWSVRGLVSSQVVTDSSHHRPSGRVFEVLGRHARFDGRETARLAFPYARVPQTFFITAQCFNIFLLLTPLKCCLKKKQENAHRMK